MSNSTLPDWARARIAAELTKKGAPPMTLEQLQSARQSALTHLNTVRRARASVGDDIRLAAHHGEHVAPATLELHDYLIAAERRAEESYGHASKLVDLRLAANAGLEA